METGADCLAVGTALEHTGDGNGCILAQIMLGWTLSLSFTGSFIWFLYSMPERKKVKEPWVRYCVSNFCYDTYLLLPALWWKCINTMSCLQHTILQSAGFLSQEQNLDPVFSDYGMANYGAQVIGIYFTVYISKNLLLSGDALLLYALKLAKMICLFSVTYLMRRIVRKRMVKDQTELYIRVEWSWYLCLVWFLYICTVFRGSFSGTWILGSYSLTACSFAGYQYLLSLCVWSGRKQSFKHKVELWWNSRMNWHISIMRIWKIIYNAPEESHDIRNHLNMLEQSAKTDNTDYFTKMFLECWIFWDWNFIQITECWTWFWTTN